MRLCFSVGRAKSKSDMRSTGENQRRGREGKKVLRKRAMPSETMIPRVHDTRVAKQARGFGHAIPARANIIWTEYAYTYISNFLKNTIQKRKKKITRLLLFVSMIFHGQSVDASFWTVRTFFAVTTSHGGSRSNSQRFNLNSTVHIRRGGLLGIRLAREGSPSNRVDQSRSSPRDDSQNRGENNDGSYPRASVYLPRWWKRAFLWIQHLICIVPNFPARRFHFVQKIVEHIWSQCSNNVPRVNR